MGVITRKDKEVSVKKSISEETLYIPSGEDDRSEASIPVPQAAPRMLRRQNIPTIGSSGVTWKPRFGKKKSRRYQNVSHLVTLAEEDELGEVTIEDFVESKSLFGRLLNDEESLQKWEAFTSSTEETQDEWIHRNSKKSVATRSVENRLTSTLRSLLKKRNLPLGMVQYLEGELIQFFLDMPKDEYVSPRLSSFERMLLHSLSDYHSLVSLSFDAEPEKVRLVKVNNPREDFPEPPQLLAEYLATVYTR